MMAALALAASLHMIPPAPIQLAVIGRPATPYSVAGAARRAHRRAYYYGHPYTHRYYRPPVYRY